MNLYLRELRANRKSNIIWSFAMIFLIFAGISKYFAGTVTGADTFNELMREMPASLQNLFGVGVFDLSKLVDYFGVLYLYIALVAGIHAVLVGNNIIAKEERDKTIEFLLVKPISRNAVITSKLLAAFTMVVMINVVTWLASIASFLQYAKEEPFATPIFHLMLGLFGLQLLFVSLGAMFAAVCKRYKLSSPIATGLLLTMFLFAIIIDISGKVDFLRYITFFKYFEAKDILKGSYNYVYIVLAALLITFFTFGSYYFYRRRDMKI